MSHCLNMLTCTTRGSNVFSTLRVLISRLLGSQLSTVWAWLKLPLACNEVSMIENCLFLALSLESAPTKKMKKDYCLWTLLLKRFSSLKSFPGKKWLHEFSTFFRKKRWICWSKRDWMEYQYLAWSSLFKWMSSLHIDGNWGHFMKGGCCQRWCWQTS